MGMGGSCRGWLPLQIPEFSKVRRSVIFDHRGVGGSEGAYAEGAGEAMDAKARDRMLPKFKTPEDIHMVVAGSDAGSKLDKANALGIEVLDEAAFLSLLEDSSE